MDKQTIVVSTRANKDSGEKKTTVTIDWADCPIDGIRALALQALVVKLQGAWRRKGIPSTAAIAVREHLPGMRARPASLEDQLAAMSADDRAALLAKYASELKGGKK